MKKLAALVIGASFLMGGMAFGAKVHHAPDSKGVPGGQRPKARSAEYKQRSADDMAALKRGEKRANLKENRRAQRATRAAKVVRTKAKVKAPAPKAKTPTKTVE